MSRDSQFLLPLFANRNEIKEKGEIISSKLASVINLIFVNSIIPRKKLWRDVFDSRENCNWRDNQEESLTLEKLVTESQYKMQFSTICFSFFDSDEREIKKHAERILCH